MTIRNLEYCLRPRSIAVVGASERPGSVGAIVLGNILRDGFKGAVYPVNLKYDRVAGLKCYRTPAELPEAPDVAVIVTPPGSVPGLIAGLAERGCRSAVVVTAGIGERDGLRQAMLDAARPHLMRIVGPNTIGLLSPLVSLNASFAHLSARPGRIGLISQSGAIVSSILDWADSENVGFSQLISLGDMSDVDVGDCLNWLAADTQTESILMYLESVPAPRKFMSAARAAARVKPVIAVKPGRHSEAARAAMTHTGALAGADDVVDAALRRAGIIRVNGIDELFSAAEVTSSFSPLRSGRLGIVTNGGGAGVLAVDDLLDQGGGLAQLSSGTIDALDQVLPATWSKGNPVDIIGDAPPERYRAGMAAVAADAGVDVVLAMNCPTALASPTEAAEAVAALCSSGMVAGKPTLACWLGKSAAEPARRLLRAAGIVTVDTPAAAARAVALLTEWSTLRSRLERVPLSTGQGRTDSGAVRSILRGAAAEGRRVLTEPEAKRVLVAYGIPAPEVIVASDEAGVTAAAARLLAAHRAVVVKLYSKTISHKSDLGGVVLNIMSAEAAGQAAAAIRARVEAAGAGSVDGFSVQPMVVRPGAQELLLGLATDPSFGPVALFGAGGTAVEVLKDTATGLLPLDDVLAGDLIDATRISRLLAGYRDRPAADRPAIVDAMLALSALAVDHPAIVAVDVNPLLADVHGVIALDARIEIDSSRLDEPSPSRSLAIRPYPAGWEKDVQAGGRDYRLRPILPADAELYPPFLARVTAEDMRLRFLVPTATIPRDTLIRLSQLDYDRDIAFVALDQHDGSLGGIARYASDPDHEAAEFGVLVRSDLQGQGLGNALMGQLICYARADGIKRIDGLILRENKAMLSLAEQLGFQRLSQPDADEAVRVRLSLGEIDA